MPRNFTSSAKRGWGNGFSTRLIGQYIDVEQNPRRWPTIRRKVRRRLVGRFPYGVLYRIAGGEILVVAVMHLHRHPRYWTKRLRGTSEK
jgi:hypothetical protein